MGVLELGFWDVVGGYYVNTPVKNLLINFLIISGVVRKFFIRQLYQLEINSTPFYLDPEQYRWACSQFISINRVFLDGYV